jgi:ABC-type transport system involved in multi-copper enzyme maturation permease subunit
MIPTSQPTLNPELVIIKELLPQIRLIGALVAVAYGFNAINKERTEGSLKVLLSYPIYRDQVILGKLIASFILIAFVSFVSLTVALALYLSSTNLLFSSELFARYLVFMCLSTLLLSGYLGLSMFFSITFKNPKTSLMAVFVLISVFNSMVFFSYGHLIANAIFGPDQNYLLTSPRPQVQALMDFVQNLSPAEGLHIIVDKLGSNRFLIYVGGEPVWIESDLWRVIMDRITAIVILVIIPVLSYSASYAYFTRGEIT